VNTSGGLMPLIRVSSPDKNGRDNGWGNFTRSYDKTADPVFFTAPEEYGIYRFDKWVKTVNSGYEEVYYNIVSVDPVNHTRLTAFYVPYVPELDLPDTVYASWSRTSLDIPVRNLNMSEELVMDWFSVTESEWFSIKEGTDMGEEDGNLSLEFSANEGAQRSGEITVYAFDASNPEKKVVIIQESKETGVPFNSESREHLIIYPVPADQEIRIGLPGNFTGMLCEVMIYDMDGRKLFSREWSQADSREISVDVSGFSPGIFIVKAIFGREVYTGKFAKD
jgi:hypothetical protein